MRITSTKSVDLADIHPLIAAAMLRLGRPVTLEVGHDTQDGVAYPIRVLAAPHLAMAVADSVAFREQAEAEGCGLQEYDGWWNWSFHRERSQAEQDLLVWALHQKHLYSGLQLDWDSPTLAQRFTEYERGWYECRVAYAELEGNGSGARAWALNWLRNPGAGDCNAGYEAGLRECLRESDAAAEARQPRPPDLYRQLLLVVEGTGVFVNEHVQCKIQEVVDAVEAARVQEGVGS